MKRVVTGVVTAALAAALILYLDPVLLGAAVTLVVLVAAAEYSALVQRIVVSRTVSWALWLAVGVLALADTTANELIDLPLPAGLTGAGTWFAAAAAILALATVAGLASHADIRDRLLTSALFTYGALWLGLFLVAAINLHTIEPVLLFWVLAVASLGDIGAYYGGRLLGRRPLAPVLSPKKTIAGAASGLAASCAAGVAVALVWRGPDALGLDVPVLALLCGAAGQAGDLVESMLKRAVQVKDAGDLLPGHGGLLDRLDSVLLAAPVFYVAVQAGAAPSLLP